MTIFCRLLLLQLIIGVTTRLYCQELPGKNFDRYSKSAGLSHDNVTGIAQDAMGYLWAGTSYGINRFDGHRFLQFHAEKEEESIGSEEITGVSAIDSHRIAFYSNGVHMVNTNTGQHHNIFIPYHNRQYMFKFNMIMKVLSGMDRRIYVLSRSGLYQYDTNYVLRSRFDYYTEEAVANTHFYFGQDLLELNEQYMLIVSDNGLYLFDKQQGKARRMAAADSKVFSEFLDFPRTPYTFLQAAPGRFFVFKPGANLVTYVDVINKRKVVSAMLFVNDGRFAWRSKLLALNDSTFYITDQNAGFYQLHFDPVAGKVSINPQKCFQQFLCNGLMVDREHNLWVATNMGLFRQNTHLDAVEVATLPAEVAEQYPSLKIDDVTRLNDRIYAGTRGGGLFVFDQEDLAFRKQVFFNQYAGKANIIRGIAQADSSTLLLAADGYPILFNTRTGSTRILSLPGWDKEFHWMGDVSKDRQGSIWISSTNLYRYWPKTGVADSIPYREFLLESPSAIHPGQNDHVWIAGHGVARYNTTSSSFDLLLDSFPYLKMPDKQVSDVVTDRQQRVWFNSRNNGIICYDPHTKKFIQFSKRDGLPDNNITSIIVVGDELWIAGYLGLSCINLSSLKITRFGKEDGFPDLPVSKEQKFYFDSIGQQLYIGFSNRLVRFNPFNLLRQSSLPNIFLETVTIGNDSSYYLPHQRISTNWDNNSVAITIGSIHFSNATNQGFAYRIFKNENTPWVQLGDQPSFNISGLAPGTNHIQVKSYAVDNRWSEQVREILIDVEPPFWRQAWFLLLLLTGLAGLLYAFVKWRIAVVRKKEMEKTRIEKLKADDYKNQFELEQISNYFSTNLSSKKSEDEILWDVTDQLMSRMHYEDCVIYLWNNDKTRMVQKAAYGPKGKPQLIATTPYEVLPGQGIVGEVVQTKRAIIVNDTRHDPRYRVDDAFRLSEIAVPIIHNNELLGVLDSENSLANYYTERDIKILTTIATLIGNKLMQRVSETSLEIKQKEIAEINEQLAEARLSALQAQMNPHFVFNALNSIKRLILESENEKASRYLSKFATMIRMTLDHSKESFVSVHENVLYLHAYIEMEKLRFDETFSYTLSVDQKIDVHDSFFPTMIIQPVIENAIWHGLLPCKENKILEIRFTKTGEKISCSVSDNGIGLRLSEHNKKAAGNAHRSMGLDNLRNRIRILNEKYHIDGALELTDLGEPGGDTRGTKVVLTFRTIRW